MVDPASSPPSPLPSGTVTFVLTDIEGSTRLWERAPALMRTALDRHNALLADAFARHRGVVVISRGEGDSFFCVFQGALDAVAAVVDAQRALLVEPWPEDCTICVRMALHTGEADLRDGEFHGHAAINRCARLRAVAHGGQVLVSSTTRGLVASGLEVPISLRDLGEHRLRDLRDLERVYQVVAPGLRDDFPPLATGDERASDLPPSTSSFIGRRQELAALDAHLASDRLLTVLGPGGSGKTRLALEAASAALDRFPDGAWLVELASIVEPDAVGAQVAATLRVQELTERALRRRRLLVVLDNCEHVLDAAADAASSLLAASTGIVVLATSREPLGLDGERLVRLGPLADEDAERLFAARAELVRGRDHEVREGADDAAVAELCARLDGNPLAIELAAARASAMSPSEILERLDDRFSLLTSRSRSRPARHQTLRDAIAWSVDGLDADARSFFERCAVFAGGWSGRSAAAVCADGASAPVEDLLLTLVDKSLVNVAGRDESRYSMLESMRECGLGELSERDELTTTRTRHLDHFLDRSAESTWPTQTWWLDRRARAALPDLDNLRSALSWSRTARPSHELALAVAAAPLWMAAGHLHEGRSTLRTALGAAEGGVVNPGRRLAALEHLVRLELELGDLEGAGDAALAARAAAEANGPDDVAVADLLLGFVAMRQLEHDAAEALFAGSCDVFATSGDAVRLSQGRCHQALLAMRAGHVDEAEARFDEVLVLGEQSGPGALVDYALLALIPGLVGVGRLEEARVRWHLALGRLDAPASSVVELTLLALAAAIAAAEGHVRRAVALSEAAVALKDRLGRDDAALLEWYWERLVPAYEALTAAELAEARTHAAELSVEGALAYAAAAEG